jgi:hypothetical protein
MGAGFAEVGEGRSLSDDGSDCARRHLLAVSTTLEGHQAGCKDLRSPRANFEPDRRTEAIAEHLNEYLKAIEA